jgi:hypothetical protein
LKIYWVNLRGKLPGLGLGVGITARDWDDAVLLLSEGGKVLCGEPIDASMIESWREVKDVAELEQKHVRPNMGEILRRGIWFPNVPYLSNDIP